MAGTILHRLTPEEQKAIEDAVVDYLIRRALEKKIATKPEDLVVRDILPGTDLNGLSGEVWVQSLSAFQYVSVYSGKNPDTKIFAVFGAKFLSPTPKTAVIRFKLGAGGAKIKDIWQVEPAFVEENCAVYTDRPIKYEDDETFVIEFYGKDSGEDNVVLLGKVVEPKGELIMGE